MRHYPVPLDGKLAERNVPTPTSDLGFSENFLDMHWAPIVKRWRLELFPPHPK